MLGSFVLSSGYYDAYYLKALQVKAMIKAAFDQAFARYDCILSPAPRLGESLQDPLRMYLGDIYTVSANLAGLPAISLPCGVDHLGLPIGLQLMGDCFQEKKLLRVAYTYEQLRRDKASGQNPKQAPDIEPAHVIRQAPGAEPAHVIRQVTGAGLVQHSGEEASQQAYARRKEGM